MRATAVGLAVLLGGCVLSVEPFIAESDGTFDPRLLGCWEEVDGSDLAVISRTAQNSYAIDYTSDGKPCRFEARAGRLGGRLVLDVWPARGGGDLPPPYADLLVAGHALLTLDVGPEEIRGSALEQERLRGFLDDGSMRLAHTLADDHLVLWKTTEESRAAPERSLAQPGPWGAFSVWRRASGTAATGPSGPVDSPCFEASAWREADELFHRDPHWVGGDGSGSVDLGGGRILWLFADSWIDPSGRKTRRDARMVSNSVAVQTGTDPTVASMRFYWGRASDGAPAAFIPDDGDERHWFGSGVRIGDRLVLFLGRIRASRAGLGFESAGWAASMVDNPDAEPSSWRISRIATPPNPLGIVVGFAAVLRLDGHVYAFGSQDPVKSHPIYAARWPVEQVHRGDLLHPEWWAGDRLGWVPDSSTAPRWPLFENGQSGLSIHVDPATQRFLAVQTEGFGPADVTIRAAPALTGPWSTPRMVYRPPEYYRPNVLIYDGRAHPELTGADLVLSYDTNTLRSAELLSDSRIYYPRLLHLTRCQTSNGR